METIYFETEESLPDNQTTMCYYLDYINATLDIIEVDGTYAEGVDCHGNLWAIHASGNGDFNNHKIEFELLNAQTKK